MQHPTISPKQKKQLNKLVPFLWSGLVFVVCAVCAGLVWFQYLANTSSQTVYQLLNDDHSATATLEDGVPLTQEFESFIPICGVGVYFERLSEDVAGTLTVQLLDVDTGELLVDTIGNISSVQYDGFTSFALDTPITTWDVNHSYLLIITANYTVSADQLALSKSATGVETLGTLTENSVETEGALVMMVTYDQLGDTPVRCYLVLSLLFALCAAGLFYLCFFAKGKFALTKPMLAFVAVLVVGIFYQFALPAFSAPDELSHYNTAYGLTNQWFGLTPETEGATLVKRSTDAQATFVDYYTDAYTYRYIADYMWKGVDGTYVEESVTLLGPYYLPYYLSAIGLAIGQLLGWNGILTAFFARTLNLIFFAAMVALSVKLAPFGKKIFVAVALLPITLHVGGSFSYDSCLIAISFVILALGLRLIHHNEKAKWYELCAFVVLCFLIGPLKMAYFPLTLLAVFIPARHFAKRWRCYLLRVVTPLFSFLHFLFYNSIIIVIQLLIYVDMDYVAWAIPATADTVVTDSATYGVGTYTVSTLIAHPGVTLKMVINTFFTNFTGYFTSMLGGSLGYQDLAEVNLNILIIVGFLLLLIFACIPQKGERMLPCAQRLTIGFSVLCVLGILVLACFSWTLVTYDTIWGFQGRYLLPILPFAMYAMQPSGISLKTDGFAGVVFAGVALNFMALLNVVSITFLR